MAVAVDSPATFAMMSQVKQVEREVACSILEERIHAPVDVVWSVLRDFKNPHVWMPFVTGSEMVGEVKRGARRLVFQKSGIPGSWRRERLDLLDDQEKVMVYTVEDGDTGTKDGSVTVCVREAVYEGRLVSLVQHCYLLPPPPGSSKDDALTFISFSSRLVLRHLASYAESLALEMAVAQTFHLSA